MYVYLSMYVGGVCVCVCISLLIVNYLVNQLQGG